MRRQHRQLLAGRLEEKHQDVVGGGVGLAGLVGAPFVPVSNGGLIPVVAVRDRDRLAPGRGQNAADLIGERPVLGRDPEAVAHAVVVGDIDVGRRCRDYLHRLEGNPASIGVHPDKRARIHAGRDHELETVFLRSREGSLVRQDSGSRSECLEPEASEEADLGPRPSAPRDAVRLLVDVDAGAQVLAQGSVGAPPGQELAGSSVAVVRLVAGQRFGQLDPDHVMRAAAQQLLVQLRPDDVVGRAYDCVQIACDRRVEPKRAKWCNFRQRCSSEAPKWPGPPPRPASRRLDEPAIAGPITSDRKVMEPFGPLRAT